MFDQILEAIPPGTEIPKPRGRAPFTVKGVGTRRGERALVYYIPNWKHPDRPHQKGVNESELARCRARLDDVGELTRSWFVDNLPECQREGDSNFTTIGGLFVLLGTAEYVGGGVFRRTTP